MNWFKNLKTAAKLVSSFACLALIAAFVGWWGLSGMGQLSQTMDTLYERDLSGLSAVKEANINLLYISRAVRAAILADDKAEVETHMQRVAKYSADMVKYLDKTEATLVTDHAKAAMAKTRAAVPTYLADVQQILKLALEGKDGQAIAAVTSARVIADQVDNEMATLAETKEKLALQAHVDGESTYQRARMVMLGVIAGAVILAFALGIFMARLIAGPLVATVDVLQGVAAGDLTRSLDINSSDEVGQMATALNHAVTAMRQAMIEVRGSADSVSSASQQLAAAAEELSSGAQEQASSQEETSATMEEISATVKQNAGNAKQANQLALGSRESAEKGGEVVGSAVTAMSEINSASKRIADIITTIDEIAFQTNLLALNAAVEAARAGEQGRGFAVVASEVRSLAQRSATAAKEIKSLIQDSVRKVENGSELVTNSGKTLGEIITHVKRVTDIVAEIAAASDQQAMGVDQVTRAMAQMDTVTQQNSAQTEELSSTAQSMSAHAEQLQALVAKFKVGSESAQPVKPATRLPARTKTGARPSMKKSPPPDTGSMVGLSHRVAAEDAEKHLVGGGFEEY